MINLEGQKRIVVTGVGIVGPLGCGVEEVWKRLLAGRSGIRNLPEDITEGTGEGLAVFELGLAVTHLFAHHFMSTCPSSCLSGKHHSESLPSSRRIRAASLGISCPLDNYPIMQ